MGKEWAFKENYFLLKEQIDINWSGKNFKGLYMLESGISSSGLTGCT